jgi:hypothetical protein
MRTPHRTPHTSHAPLAMDAMPPWRAFGPTPAPSALDPRRWLGIALAMLAGVAARMARPGATARAPAVEAES